MNLSLINLLNEMIETEHFVSRSVQRFLNNEPLDVVYSVRDRYSGQFREETVGEFTIPQNAFNKIKDGIKFLKLTSSDSSTSFNFAIKLFKFNYNVYWRDIIFNRGVNERELFDLLNKHVGRLSIRERGTTSRSTGNVIIILLKGESLVTTFFSPTDDDDKINERLKKRPQNNGEEFIVLENPYDIKQYLRYSGIK